MLTRPVPLILLALLLILQGQLWLGRGSVTKVWQLQEQLQEQKKQNAQAELGIERSRAELRDLREGLEMVQERARREIGMVKANEIFVQIAK
ncbi:MAG: septum formation initiator family protein [Betaproteobacteria bacterium]|jgi:cell division protein FtsB|nr:septation ring formation regulator EzrA [Betaproteobacteria bacterium]NBT67242.1 septation ring formation regulator EzrA [Betaproteobacteria bacterium]NBY07378.1 septation ring formation regulator EzrA [Betaproteobacteria bacterium]